MFTGIVETPAKVLALRSTRHGKRLTVRPTKRFTKLRRGQSLSVNGVCLSIVNGSSSNLSFDVIPETLRRSNLGSLRRGNWINLERALKYGDRLDGHCVQGHIEARGRLLRKSSSKRGVSVKISYPPKLRPFIVPKGYISVDGISLTIGEVSSYTSLRGRRRARHCEGAQRPKQSKPWFTVYIVPITWRSTNLRTKKSGDSLNLETDILLRSRRRGRRV